MGPDGVAAYTEQLARLGGHKAAVGCLYIGKVDLAVLEHPDESYRTVTAGTFGHRAAESNWETDSVDRSCR